MSWQDYPCIIWEGSLSDGYGYFYEKAMTADGARNRRKIQAHRRVYEETQGPIPAGFHIDHLCRNPPCVQTFHLEAVTIGENVRRGILGQTTRARSAAQTHCKRNHPLSGDNIRIRIEKGYSCRVCISCVHVRNRERKAKLE